MFLAAKMLNEPIEITFIFKRIWTGSSLYFDKYIWKVQKVFVFFFFNPWV